MAYMNGHIYFTKRQLERMLKGKDVIIFREGKKVAVGMKKIYKAEHIAKLQHKLAYYQKKLKQAGVIK